MIDLIPRLQAVAEDVKGALSRAQRIIDFVNHQQPPPEIRVAVLNNVIVSLVSIVEEGLRSLFAEYISVLEENVGSYHRIRRDLLGSNIRSASELLAQSLDDSKKVDAAGVAKDLLMCLNDDAGFKLFKNQITYNRYNMRSKEVSAISSRIGVRKIWESVRTQDALKGLFPDLDDEQVEQSMLAKWNALFDERDTIVHRFSQAKGWGDTIISPYIAFLAILIDSITAHLAADAKIFLESIAVTE